MTARDWQTLIVTTVTDPGQVARGLIDLKLPREALWTGLALAAVLNAILIGISNIVAYPDPLMPQLLQMPVLLGFAVFVALATLVFAFSLCGRWLGGHGSFDEVMVVVLWLQALRILVQVTTLVLAFIAPILALLIAFAAGLLGIYITLHFLNEAHRLQSLGKAAGVLIASMVLMVLALTFLLSLVGGPVLEVASGV